MIFFAHSARVVIGERVELAFQIAERAIEFVAQHAAGVARLLTGGELLLSTGSGWPGDPELLREFSSAEGNYRVAHRMNLDVRIAEAEAELARMTAADYRESLVGTIGRQAQFG